MTYVNSEVLSVINQVVDMVMNSKNFVYKDSEDNIFFSATSSVHDYVLLYNKETEGVSFWYDVNGFVDKEVSSLVENMDADLELYTFHPDHISNESFKSLVILVGLG